MDGKIILNWTPHLLNRSGQCMYHQTEHSKILHSATHRVFFIISEMLSCTTHQCRARQDVRMTTGIIQIYIHTNGGPLSTWRLTVWFHTRSAIFD